MTLDKLYAKAKKRGGNAKKLSYDDVMQEREIESVKASKKINEERIISERKKFFDRSGILPLYENCTVENFIADTPDKQHAKDFAQYFINGFFCSNGQSFIFSGETGTGKNHLASAICSELISYGKSCLVITVSEMMIKLRKCYGKDAEISEDEFIKRMLNLDLLVIDEIGLQKNTDSEKLVLNQIIDQRVSRLKSTGILTNLGGEDLTKFLGVRIISRLKMNNGQWIVFNWEDYRK